MRRPFDRTVVCGLIVGAMFLLSYTRVGISQELASNGTQRASLRMDSAPRTAAVFRPRSIVRAALDESAGPLVSKHCEFSKEELENLSDSEAERLVSHSLSALRARDSELFTLAVLSQPERSKRELFLQSPRLNLPTSSHGSTFYNVEGTVSSVRLCNLRRLKQFGSFAEAGKGVVAPLVSDPNVRSEALAVLNRMTTPAQGGTT